MTDIILPKNDTNTYKHIILPNDLQVIIINDTTTQISTLSLNINVGYYSDPSDTPGLAHFLEHMIFMGSTKYPNINKFMQYINKNGGSTNAYTSFNNTNYYFNIISSKFKKAIDIFYNLLYSPLFDINYINKEMNAVNSEHSKNILDDNWRLMEILKYTSSHSHPFSKFGTGTLNTLKNAYTPLLKFYKTYYSSNIMKLVIHTNISSNIIEKLINKTFSNLKNHNITPKIPTSSPLSPKFIKMNPINNSNTLHIFFQLKSTISYFKSKPLNILLYIFNHQGTNTYGDMLLKKKLCTDYLVSPISDDLNNTILHFEYELTDKGLKKYPFIINQLNYYITLIKTANLAQFYDEQKILNQIMFDTMEKTGSFQFINNIQENFINYPIKYLLYAPFCYLKYDPKLLKELLNEMTIQTVILNSSNKINPTDKEPYYNIDFEELPLTFPPTSKYPLYLPTKNNYIPTNIHNKGPKTLYPTLLISEPNFQVYYKSNSEFITIPRTIYSIILYSKNIYSTIENYISYNLYINLLMFQLNSKLYYANFANSHFYINIKREYIQIYITSYNDVIIQILKDILTTIPNEKYFNYIKDEYKTYLKNISHKSLIKISLLYACKKILPIYYDHESQLKIIDNITPLRPIPDNIKIFIYGNIKSHIIDQSIKLIKSAFKTSMPSLQSSMPSLQSSISNNNDLIYNFKTTKNNYSTYVLYKISNQTNENTVLLSLFLNIISEDFFYKLRSKKQYGYIVRASNIKLGNLSNETLYITFYIQSPNYTPDILYKEIKKFVNKINITTKLFNLSKDNLNKKYSEPFKNQKTYYNYLCEQIINGKEEYNQLENLKKVLEKTTYEDLIKFYKKYLKNCNVICIMTSPK